MTSTAESTEPSTAGKMTLPTLTAMVVGGMVGAGSSPCRLGSASRRGSSVR